MITLSNQEFKLLADYVYNYCGIDLKQKKHLIESRLHNQLLGWGFTSFSAFYNYLLNDVSGEMIITMVDKLSTNHTYFMRESQHFDFFGEKVLPELTGKIKNRDVRIWSAGCSSGEEAYTLAMIMADFFGSQWANWDTRILATDISTQALKKAREAIYEKEDIEALPAKWRLNYFEFIHQRQSRIIDKVRKQVIFRRFNLMENSFPFKKQFHVIFCRNVMIYFDSATKRELVNRFYDSVVEGGYLFIGQAESLERGYNKFKYVMPAVYRKE